MNLFLLLRDGRNTRRAHRDHKEPFVRGPRGRDTLRARTPRYGARGRLRRDGPDHIEAAPPGAVGGGLEGNQRGQEAAAGRVSGTGSKKIDIIIVVRWFGGCG